MSEKPEMSWFSLIAVSCSWAATSLDRERWKIAAVTVKLVAKTNAVVDRYAMYSIEHMTRMVDWTAIINIGVD